MRMIIPHVHPGLAVLALLFSLDHGDAAEPLPQYRFRQQSIPGAESDEPGIAFSSELANQHVDLASTLWASQKKCFSCHTHGIYMLVRPALSEAWGRPGDDTRAFVVEQSEKLIANDDRYGSVPVQMAYIARGLAAWDSAFSQETSPETDAALRHLFTLQAEDGSIRVKDRWPPINSTTWYGSTMAAVAAADAPGWLSGLDDGVLKEKIGSLVNYLKTTAPRNGHERLMLLWASTFMPELLTDERRQSLIEMVWSHQQADGGWSLRTFATPESIGGGKRGEALKTNEHYLNPTSDGYQTGLAVVVLRDAGVASGDPRIRKAVDWLLANQRQSGRWWTRSLNADSRFHFISFSGTAYASLALAKCGALPRSAR